MGGRPNTCTPMGVQDGRERMHGRQSMRWVLGVLEMNSAAMEYNMSRHPELYYMDTFGVIRLNETEYKKQTEVKQMSEIIEIKGTAKKPVMRGGNGQDRLVRAIGKIESLGFTVNVTETSGYITLEDVTDMIPYAEYKKAYNDILEA